MKPYIRPAEIADCEHIALHMKRPDVEEVMASHGYSPWDAISYSFNHSDMAGTVCDAAGVPVLMYGVAPGVAPDTGCPWMLSTAALYRPDMRRFFIRWTASVIDRMHSYFPILIQHVDARHSHSLLWMKWAGFTFDALLPEWGVERRPFFRMSRIGEHAVDAPVLQVRPH